MKTTSNQKGNGCEHVVDSFFSFTGLWSYRGEFGSPVDRIVAFDSRLLRVEIKKVRRVGRYYTANLMHHKRDGSHEPLNRGTVDLYAFVDVATREIAWIAEKDIAKGRYVKTAVRLKANDFIERTFEKALLRLGR